MICTSRYFRLLGSDKDKIAKVSRSMFRKRLEIKEVLNFYYVETYIHTNLFLNTTISIPRHLLFADTVLIVIEFRMSSDSQTFLYANGLVFKNNNQHHQINFYQDVPLETLFDIGRKNLFNGLNKETLLELEKIKSSRLYNSMIRKEHTRPRRRGPLCNTEEFYLNHFLNKNYKYLTLCQNLDFEAFYNLYS